ncbi:MAG: hypothetical protein QM770_10900 [Tepidisphaeraceae bacterium]
MTKRLTTLSEQTVADLREIKRRVYGQGVSTAITNYSTDADTGCWVKITANTGAVDTDYTVDVYTGPYAPSPIATGKKARNVWERVTNAGYASPKVTGIERLPIDSWHKVTDRSFIDDDWKLIISERNEPKCG